MGNAGKLRPVLAPNTFITQEKLYEPTTRNQHIITHIPNGGTNTVYELRRGEKFAWALHLTAVVVRAGERWQFAQMNFSFPTIYFPDVRLMDQV